MDSQNEFIEELHIKDKLLKTAWRLNITNDQFDAFNIHDWPEVFKKIESKFIVKENANIHFNWWWEHLKGDQLSMSFTDGNPWKYLHLIVEEKEKVWFVACDSSRDPSKLWLFEGFVQPIQQVSGHLSSFEYYLISKKYDWFLAENHHGVLIGLGSIKPKMIQLKNIHL